ncbi:MAG: DUF2461 domain-containing protein [Thiohalomonadales bacterium]
MAERYFTPASFDFLSTLTKNNNRAWFTDHKQQYEDAIRSPALKFIGDFSDELVMISPHFLASAKKVGGSLMRIHKDMRFSKDGSNPYKTNIGIQFRHQMGKDVHAPGFYVHIEAGNCFLGVGIWRPDSPSLGKIRDFIIDNEKAWLSASQDKLFRKRFELSGESLTNPPRGYDKNHPLIDDLKRKDFIAFCNITDKTVCSARFTAYIVDRFQSASTYVHFLCDALRLPY